MKETNTFAVRLRELRKARKLTQQKIAERLGISSVSFGAWERGEAEPSIDSIVKLCDILDVSADYLIGIGDEEKREDAARRVSRLGGGADVMQSVLDRMKTDISELEKML